MITNAVDQYYGKRIKIKETDQIRGTVVECKWASSIAVRALAYCAEDHGSGPT